MIWKERSFFLSIPLKTDVNIVIIKIKRKILTIIRYKKAKYINLKLNHGWNLIDID